MTGSLQTKHGKYYVVVRIPDENGIKKAKWINTGIPTEGNNKRRAQQRQREILAELEDSKGTISTDMPFIDWIEEWMKDKESAVKQGKMALNTFESYRSYIDLHIGPFFKKKGLSLKSITSKDIQAFYDAEMDEGQSPNSIHRHNVVILGALREAKRKKLIRDNPADDAILPPRAKFEGKAYTAPQAMALLAAVEGEPIKPAIVLGLYYGLRRSEVLGLRWQDIDFEAGVLKIRNTVVRTKTLLEREHTKSEKSRRTIPLVPETIPYLKDLKATHDIRKTRYTDGHDPDPIGHVCTGREGKPFSPDYISHTFRRMLQKHNLPPLRFHELRHTAGSLLLANGISVKQVSEYLGHEKVSTTLDIYAHVDFEGKKETVQRMGSLLGNC